MDKITEANFALGEASAYTSLGLGGIGMGVAIYYGDKTLNLAAFSGLTPWLILILLGAGGIVYFYGVYVYFRYTALRKKLN